MSAEKRNHARRPENTNVSISLPREMLAQIDELAEREYRNRSQLIVWLLQRPLAQSAA